MAHQEDGWPLGLRPLNARVGFVRSRNTHGSISFSTLLTESLTTSTDSSSDFDTESTGSFLHDKSITLGNLIGISSILEMSRRSSRARTTGALRDQKNYKPKSWLFSLCSRLTTDAVNRNYTPSLGHFLEAERRVQRRSMNHILYETSNGFSPVALPNSNLNPLFVGGRVGPESALSRSVMGRRNSAELLGHGNGYGAPLLFSRLCGQLIK